MSFVLIGGDAPSLAFVQAAQAGGDRLLAVVCPRSIAPVLTDVPHYHSLSEIETLRPDYLVVAPPIEERAMTLRWLTRREPTDLVIALPASTTLDLYFEVALYFEESRLAVLPMMTELEHPLSAKLGDLIRSPRMVRAVQWRAPSPNGQHPPRYSDGWFWIRQIVGEIESVSATESKEIKGRPREMIVTALAASGCVCALSWRDHEPTAQLVVELDNAVVRATFIDGPLGPTKLQIESGGHAEEVMLHPARLGERLYRRFRRHRTNRDNSDWLHATRQFELGDAVDYSIRRERTVSLSYDEFTEQAGFKSIMTALGCGMMWLVILMAILAALGVPMVHRLVLPMLLGYLALQLLALVYRRGEAAPSEAPPSAGALEKSALAEHRT